MRKIINKRAQSFGGVLVTAIGVIVAVVILQASAQQVGSTTNLELTTNGLVTFPNTAAGLVLNGRAVEGVVTVTNRTSGVAVTSGNWTVTNNVVQTDGTLAPVLRPTGASSYNNTAVNVTYTYQPDTYDDSSAGRSISAIVVLFAALAIAVYALGGVNIKELVGA